jgi:hypothetical protein
MNGVPQTSGYLVRDSKVEDYRKAFVSPLWQNAAYRVGVRSSHPRSCRGMAAADKIGWRGSGVDVAFVLFLWYQGIERRQESELDSELKYARS